MLAKKWKENPVASSEVIVKKTDEECANYAYDLVISKAEKRRSNGDTDVIENMQSSYVIDRTELPTNASIKMMANMLQEDGFDVRIHTCRKCVFCNISWHDYEDGREGTITIF